MGRIVLKIIFLLSISLNIVLGYHILITPAEENPGSQLKLSGDQKSRLQEIRKKMNLSNDKLKNQIADCQKKLVQMLKGEEVDKEEVDRCINTISSLQKKLQQNTIDEIIKIKGVLNQKQCDCFMENLDRVVKKKCNAECPRSKVLDKTQR